MAFSVPIDQAKNQFPEFEFIEAFPPSAQKAAFHVKNQEGKDYCLKLIAPNYVPERLEREILALEQINHPNIASLQEYVFSSKGGTQKHYILEDFVEGKNLSEIINSGKALSLDTWAIFFSQMCEGLAVLNEKEIVHRDLKPNNIRVRPNKVPVIIDFGVARHLVLDDLTPTSEGAKFGTAPYFSPEQCKETKYEIDHRTDLFALGVILYECVVGKHPFLKLKMTHDQLSDAICESEEYQKNPNFQKLPKKWQILIRKLLGKKRIDRPKNANQVLAILKTMEETK